MTYEIMNGWSFRVGSRCRFEVRKKANINLVNFIWFRGNNTKVSNEWSLDWDLPLKFIVLFSFRWKEFISVDGKVWNLILNLCGMNEPIVLPIVNENFMYKICTSILEKTHKYTRNDLWIFDSSSKQCFTKSSVLSLDLFKKQLWI